MDNITLISIIVSFSTTIFTSILVFNAIKLKKGIALRQKEKKTQATLSYQRERIESEVYAATEKLLGSNLRFEETNHLFYNEPSPDIKLSEHVIDESFFHNLGINIQDMEVEKNCITCLMPFHKSIDRLYDTIKKTCSSVDFQCTRSDDEFKTGNILKYTLELILKSQIIIAVMDGRNPNVFYEIGIAHSIGKTVILLANYSKMEDIPFNLKSNRFIFYKNYNELNSELSNALKSVTNDRRE